MSQTTQERSVGERKPRSFHIKHIFLVIGFLIYIVALFIFSLFMDTLYDGLGVVTFLSPLSLIILPTLFRVILPEKWAEALDKRVHTNIFLCLVIWFALATPISHLYNTRDYYTDSDNQIYVEYHGNWYHYDYDKSSYYPSEKPNDIESIDVETLHHSMDKWDQGDFIEFKKPLQF